MYRQPLPQKNRYVIDNRVCPVGGPDNGYRFRTWQSSVYEFTRTRIQSGRSGYIWYSSRQERICPVRNTTAIVMLPSCDFCKEIALYDGKTHLGPWAYMCERHFNLYGVGIGPEKGQKLVLVKPRSALLQAPEGLFAVAGQVSALLQKYGQSGDAYNFAWQLFQCKDRKEALALLEQYVYTRDSFSVSHISGHDTQANDRRLNHR